MKSLNRLSKKEALKQLRKLDNEIPGLYAMGRKNQAFEKWLQNVERKLDSIFVDFPHHVEEFRKISFEPLIPIPDYVDLLNTKGEAFLGGLAEIRVFLKKRINEINNYWRDEVVATKVAGRRRRKIFVIHGHDEVAKDAVVAVLKRLAFKPIVLHEQPNLGRTIIEKFEHHSADVSFAVVILSPDDLAYSKSETPVGTRARARQNVILELGFFLGKLGRRNVFLLLKKDAKFEIPSDYSGVMYTLYDESGKWRLELVKELRACGFEVDANKL